MIMSTERCADLVAVAIANKQKMSWIARQPFLLLAYMAQYMPTLTRFIAPWIISEDRLKKMA